MADGSITFSTALDNSELDKQIKDAEAQINNLKKTVEQKTSKRNAIKEKIDEADQAIEATRRDIDRLKARLEELDAAGESPMSGRRQAVVEELDKASKSLVKQVENASALDSQYYKIDEEVAQYSARLKGAEASYQQLSNAAAASMNSTQAATGRAADTIRNRLGSAAVGARSVMTNAANSVGNTWEMVANKVTKTMRKVFIFGLIVSAIRAIKNELSSMIAQNAQFHASIENLKVVASGFIAAFGNVVLPAFIGVVNVLAGILERVAGLIDFIFGSNIAGMIAQARASAGANIQASNAQALAQNSNKAANAANKQAKAAKNLAKEQKKANRQLLAFDDLNVLSKEDAEDAADAMDDLADVGGISDVPALTPDWTAGFMPDAGIFQPILDWLDEIRRRIETDVEGPFARIREGLNLIKKGISEVAQGILNGDWALAWRGLGDIVIGILYVIQGAITAFFDWLNEITGGQFAGLFAGLSLFLQGVVDLVEGLLRGNIEQAITGIHEMIDGACQAAYGLVEGLVGLIMQIGAVLYDWLSGKIDEAMDYLIQKYPQFTGFFEGLRGFLHGILDFLANSVKSTLDFMLKYLGSILNSAKQIVHGAVDIITGLLSLDGDRIWRGVKSVLNGIISLVESALNMLIDGVAAMADTAAWALNFIPGVDIPALSYSPIRLPRLAGGAVIPPNREFLAVLGDQTSGTNVEAPEGLIRQIVREESGNGEIVMLLSQMLTALQARQTIECDGYTLARVVNNQNRINRNIYGA